MMHILCQIWFLHHNKLDISLDGLHLALIQPISDFLRRQVKHESQHFGQILKNS